MPDTAGLVDLAQDHATGHRVADGDDGYEVPQSLLVHGARRYALADEVSAQTAELLQRALYSIIYVPDQAGAELA